MYDPKQLPYLIQLLDDTSPIVRESVIRQLTEFGTNLPSELIAQRIIPSQEQLKDLQPILAAHNREWLRREWPTWQVPNGDKERLEAALSLLAEFLHWRLHAVKLGALIDELVIEFDATGLKQTPLELAKFLFSLKGFGAIEESRYYDSMNSSLVHVIEEKRGIPISLSAIYVLVGHRLGIEIEGCNYPGHFLTIATLRKHKVVVDCFHGGGLVMQQALKAVNAAITIEEILRYECRSPAIVARVLRNLINSFERETRVDDAELMKELLATIETP